MPRPGIHPMRHLVRVVLPNGASVVTEMAWQRPYACLDVSTVFLDESSSAAAGSALSKAMNKGRRARFEDRFLSSDQPSKTE